MLPMLLIFTSLLLPPMGQFSVAICTWQILCLMEILDANSLTVNQVRNSAIGPVVLAMLGSYHFFKTGHQAVLSTIQWNAAFIPLRTIRYPWSPLLLIFQHVRGSDHLCCSGTPDCDLEETDLQRWSQRTLERCDECMSDTHAVLRNDSACDHNVGWASSEAPHAVQSLHAKVPDGQWCPSHRGRDPALCGITQYEGDWAERGRDLRLLRWPDTDSNANSLT